LFAAWELWRVGDNIESLSDALFGRKLLELYPAIKATKPANDDGKRIPTYDGICLRSSQ